MIAYTLKVRKGRGYYCRWTVSNLTMVISWYYQGHLGEPYQCH